MSRFRRCFLHIGFEKTGSTSIQTFLTENAASLQARGYFAPASLARNDGFRNHIRLAAYALADNKNTDDVRLHYGINSPSQVPRFREETIERLDRECEAASGCRFIVLSNEHLSSRVVEIAEISRLKQLLEGIADTVKVFAYVRSQTGLLQSVYNEAIKSGLHDIELVPDFSTPPDPHWISRRYFEYGAVLDDWAEVFGEGNLIVKLFEPEELLYGDVVQDFLLSIHLDPSRFSHFPRVNEGLDRRAQLVLHHLNRRLDRLAPAHAGRIRDRLVDILMHKARGRGIRLTQEQAARFQCQFQHENERLRQRWFPARHALFRSPEHVDPNESQGITAEESLDIITLVLAELVA